jgi:hypothetical protein
MEGDLESNYAYYCLHKFHWPPSRFLSMDREEQAFIAAAIDIKNKDDEEKVKEIERQGK